MLVAAESLSRIIGFDSQLILDSIITGINVFILFFALSYFLFNPVQKALADRKNKIKNEIENAKKQEADALELKAEYEKKMDDVRKEVENIMSEAKKNADRQVEEKISAAKLEAANIVARGHNEVEQEKAKAVEDLKNQVISISTLLATKIIKENVDAKREDELFDETMKEIGENSWQG